MQTSLLHKKREGIVFERLHFLNPPFICVWRVEKMPRNAVRMSEKTVPFCIGK